MKKQEGFTLVELIIVIVLLGILAAYAIPKYMSINREARISVTESLYGSVRAASDMVHGISEAQGVATGTITIAPGTTVTVNTGYATAAVTGIAAALADLSDFTVVVAANTITFQLNSAPNPATCCVTYTYVTGGGNVPVVTVTTSGA